MKPETAKALIELIRVIDSNVSDWIDAVCVAREKLPTGVADELAALAFGCETVAFSSRCCERGTKTCVVNHGDFLNRPETDQ